MKIIVERDNRLLKMDDTDIERITIERDGVVSLDECLLLFGDLLNAMGYRYRGTLTIEEDEDVS